MTEITEGKGKDTQNTEHKKITQSKVLGVMTKDLSSNITFSFKYSKKKNAFRCDP